MSRLVESLHSGRVLLMDGAMGSELQRLGLGRDREVAESTATWNVTCPEAVASVHAAYLEAGAEVLLTNTFSLPFDYRPGHAERPKEIWQAARNIVRVFKSLPVILGSFGPTMLGRFRFLSSCCDVDGLLLETWDGGEPGRCEVFLSRCGRLQLPLLVSFAFQKSSSRRYLDNCDYEAQRCAMAAMHMGAVALGANCGKDMDIDDLLRVVRIYRQHTDLPIFIRPNAGTPTRTESGWEYPRSPEYMADKLWPLLEAGVTMVGGCCGTTPAHIAAFRRVVDQWNEQHSPLAG